MQLLKNRLVRQTLPNLQKPIESFICESGNQFDKELVISSTFRNIQLGLDGKAVHDTWISGTGTYCLCRAERDADGQLVYVAYQLWIEPKMRCVKVVKGIVKFLRFYAQKQGYKRLYVISSRLDKIKAYARGLGKRFKVQSVTFVDEL